jgi:hypothetical protein
MPNNIHTTKPVTRRSFLFSTGAITASSLLAGCVPLAVRPDQVDQRDARLASNSRKRGMSSAEVREAQQAHRVFNAMARTQALPVDEHLTFLAGNFRQELRAMPAILNDVSMADIGGDLSQIIRAGLSRRRRRAGSAAPAITRRDGGILDIPSMSAATTSMHGYCMDQQLPAPKAGDLLRFRPAADYASGSLSDIEKAVLVYAQANPNKVAYQTTQHLIWGLRGIGTESTFTSSLAKRSDLLGILDKAKPGSASRFVSEFNKTIQSPVAREQTHKMMPPLANLEKLTNDLSNIFSGNASVDAHLSSLNRPGAEQGQVPELAAYSIMAPGVYMRAKGTSPLALDAMIVNLSGDSFRFNPVEWVAETQLPQQRVSFSGIKSAGDLQVAPVGNFDIGAFLADAGRDIGEKTLGMLDPRKASLRAAEISKASRWFTKSLVASGLQLPLTVLPVVGNIIAMHELRSGLNFFTGEKLTTAEMTLAAFSSIPGYGSIVKAAGSLPMASKMLGSAISSRAVSVPFSAIEKADWIRDIGNIGTMDVTENEKLWEASARIVKGLVGA